MRFREGGVREPCVKAVRESEEWESIVTSSHVEILKPPVLPRSFSSPLCKILSSGPCCSAYASSSGTFAARKRCTEHHY